jgi:hypothetical protein
MMYMSRALGRLLKGDAGNETRELIDKALELSPDNWMALYCDALYELSNKGS